MMTRSGVELKAGQTWEEVDPRVVGRQVRIKSIRDGSVEIYCEATKRTTFALILRFTGKRGGYKFVRD